MSEVLLGPGPGINGKNIDFTGQLKYLPVYSVSKTDPPIDPGVDDCEKKCLEEKYNHQLTNKDLTWGFVHGNQYGLKNNTKLDSSYQWEPIFETKNTKVNEKQIKMNERQIRVTTELLNKTGLIYNSGNKKMETNPFILTAVEQQALNCNIIPAVIYNPLVGNENADSGFKGLKGLSLYSEFNQNG